MQSIKYNKEKFPILNQTYDILAELLAKDKKNTLCKVPAHIGTEWYEEADRTAKEEIDMPWITTTRLPYTDCYLTIRRAGNSWVAKEVGKQ